MAANGRRRKIEKWESRKRKPRLERDIHPAERMKQILDRDPTCYPKLARILARNHNDE